MKAEEAEKKVRTEPVALVQGNILKTGEGIVTENVVEKLVCETSDKLEINAPEN